MSETNHSDKTKQDHTKIEKPAKRFLAKEPSFVEVYGKPDLIPAKMKNLSATGLCLELEPNSSETIAKGDIVRVIVKLKDLNKDRVVNAEVIWVKEGEAGLCFIPPNQVLDKLLEKSMSVSAS
jgi:hypothetical protein